MPVFKTGAINHSANSPLRTSKTDRPCPVYNSRDIFPVIYLSRGDENALE